MKVRIVKCNQIPCWYKDQIGSVFNVVENRYASEIMYFMGDSHGILKEDCEILEADGPKPEPFDLDRALKGEKVITHDGRVVDEVIHVKSLKNYGNIMIICDGAYAFVDKNGKAQHSEWDVYMAPREQEYQTVWVNLYSDEKFILLGRHNGLQCSHAYLNKDEAVKNLGSSGTPIGTFPITFKKQ